MRCSKLLWHVYGSCLSSWRARANTTQHAKASEKTNIIGCHVESGVCMQWLARRLATRRTSIQRSTSRPAFDGFNVTFRVDMATSFSGGPLVAALVATLEINTEQQPTAPDKMTQYNNSSSAETPTTMLSRHSCCQPKPYPIKSDGRTTYLRQPCPHSPTPRNERSATSQGKEIQASKQSAQGRSMRRLKALPTTREKGKAHLSITV